MMDIIAEKLTPYQSSRMQESIFFSITTSSEYSKGDANLALKHLLEDNS